MKTTLVIDDHVMTRLREEAAREGTTISQLVEAALRRFLDVRDDPKSGDLGRLPSFRGGEFLADIADRDVLFDAMEER